MHQESARIEATLKTLAAAWTDLGNCELVLVDDGSTDGTPEVAERSLRENALPGRVVRLARNGGKGAAISAGVGAGRGRAVAFTDADLAADPDAIAACFQLIEDGDADVVVTSRTRPDSEVTVRPPLARRSSSFAFRRLVRWAGVRGVSDSQCGLKAFTRDAADVLFRELSVQRFAFDVEVLLRAELAGLRIVEVPIRWRHVDASSLRTLRDGARMALDVLRLRTQMRGWAPDDKTPVAALLEREHWWYVAGREIALDAADRAGAHGPVLDVDCQTGALLEAARHRGLDPAFGSSPAAAPSAYAVASSGVPAAAASPLALAVRDGSTRTVFALDLLEHLDDDVAALHEVARVLAPGGIVVATVPGNPRSWSAYDAAFGHRRRYSPQLLRDHFVIAGLDVVDVRRFHSWLSPVTFLLAKTPLRSVLLRDPEKSSFVNRRVNRLLRLLVGAERRLVARVHLPFGEAIVVTARKR